MTMVFINLPVRDVSASAAFWSALGFGTNPQFSDERTTNVIISESIVLMLLERSRFRDFVTGTIADPRESTGVLHALSAGSREEVDALADAALAAGGSAWLPPQDHGFMYGRSFADPEGHVFEVLWMDPAAVRPADSATDDATEPSAASAAETVGG